LKIFSTPLLILFCLVLNCPAAISLNNAYETGDAAIIKQLVSEALEYNGWVNEPDYEEKLGSLYAGKLLPEMVNSVKQFRSVCTDWHTLTFVSNCHIVYNDGNTALVLALFYEENPDGTDEGQGSAVVKIHNTTDGWRITHMDIIWPLTE